MADKLKPLGSRVLLRRIEADEKSTGGIIIPDTAKEKPQMAEVVAVGTGGRDEDGNLVPFSVKEGDTVLISKYGGSDIKLDGVEHILIKEEEILAISEP